MYQSGNIIKARVNKFPFIYHYGILTDDGNRVAHFSPNGKNDYGGSMFIDTVDDYLKTRTQVKVFPVNLNKIRVNETIVKYKEQKFNVLNNNCEHFVFEAASGQKISPQLDKFIKIIFIVIVCVLIYKARK